jgi:hypothetical protein
MLSFSLMVTPCHHGELPACDREHIVFRNGEKSIRGYLMTRCLPQRRQIEDCARSSLFLNVGPETILYPGQERFCQVVTNLAIRRYVRYEFDLVNIWWHPGKKCFSRGKRKYHRKRLKPRIFSATTGQIIDKISSRLSKTTGRMRLRFTEHSTMPS